LRPILLLALPCIAVAQASRADEWPQWRGEKRDGVWRETGILRKYPAGGPRVVWRQPIGPGYAGPSVAGGRVYCADRNAKAETERVVCLDAATGKQVWEHVYPAEYSHVDYEAGPRATPTVHAGRVYTLGTMGHLFSLDAASGKVLWKKDLDREYDARIPGWGSTAAPLIERGLVIVNFGGSPSACVVAFDAATGAEAWKALDDPPGYAPPIVVEAGGTRQLIQWTARNVVSLDPATGKEHWRHPFNAKSDLSVMTPVHHQGKLLVSSFYSGSLLLDLDPAKPAATQRWRSRRTDEHETDVIHCLMSTPQVDGDHLYGVDSYGQLRCVEIATGKRLWETLAPTGKERWSNAHLTPNGDATFIWNERGELIIARLSPEKYEELDRARLLEPTVGSEGLRPVTWAHPAYAERQCYARNDREIIRVDLGSPAPNN